MSGLAQYVQSRGTRVSGSDLTISTVGNPALDRLKMHGAALHQGHSAENIGRDVDLVVATSAVSWEENPEIVEAHRRGIRVVSRAEFLGELMAAHQGVRIAVSGTHGKTTTTAMIGLMLQTAGEDPTVFVGGEVSQLGGNCRIGSLNGPLVAEACEAYDSFLYLKPDIAVITNVEADHLDHYGTFEKVVESFQKFLQGVRNDGTVILCGDDENCANLANSLPASVKTLEYGIGNKRFSGGRGKNLSLTQKASFEWHCEIPFSMITLQVPGQHNVLNALAAATTGHILGLSAPQVVAGLQAFRGVVRRQELIALENRIDGEVRIYDDYSHHPTELRATISAFRNAFPERRLIGVFQPHLYSRTRDFLTNFAASLAKLDILIVTDIYPAREVPIPSVNAADIVRIAREIRPELDASYIQDRTEIPEKINTILKGNDVVIFMGAGNIREQGEKLASLIAKTEGPQ